jgi:plasmid stabilization system protein ParE
MSRLIVSLKARADTSDIIKDLANKAGYGVAAAYAAFFVRVNERLAEFPDSGARRPVLGPRVRICVVSPYVVIYEHMEADDTVVVLRIVHGRRKIGRKFLKKS